MFSMFLALFGFSGCVGVVVVVVVVVVLVWLLPACLLAWEGRSGAA